MYNDINQKIFLSRKSIINVITIILLSYFVFHSLYGSRGILAYFKLKADLTQKHQELQLARAERLEIEHKTKLLRPNSLDKDMLDEQIRKTLGFSDPEDKVYSRNSFDTVEK